MWKVIIVSIFALILLVGCLPPNNPPRTFGGDIYVLENNYRVSNGESQLFYNLAPMNGYAQYHSDWMVTHNSLTHSNLIDLLNQGNYSSCGENILVGPSSMTQAQIMDSFKASPAHNANLLNPNWKLMAVGVSYVNSQIWVTQEFCY